MLQEALRVRDRLRVGTTLIQRRRQALQCGKVELV
jgi:hypothetical protein